MSEGFSGVVRLSNVDDFIAPSQNCVIPLLGKNKIPKEETPKRSKIGFNQEDYKEPLPSTSSSETVTISLQDCLACSGCITSAETILVQQQSWKSFNDFLSVNNAKLPTNRRSVVVSISPQSISSLAAHFDMSIADMNKKISSFLYLKGVDHLFDSNIARTLALKETQIEALNAFLKENGSLPTPVLSSACPGWICYVEKSQSHLIPHISRVRSPMAILGALIKRQFGSDIYHCSVMPCYDKKLEASRVDFFVDGKQETDIVITAAELIEWFAADNVDLRSLIYLPQKSILHKSCYDVISCINRHSHSGSSSGGYAHHVLKHIIDVQYNHLDIRVDCKRINKDMHEYQVIDSAADQLLFRVAVANGFRNIQNVVQMMKKSQLHYVYVEVMACPNGCNNGGGQIRGGTNALKLTQEKYLTIPVPEDELSLSDFNNHFHHCLSDTQLFETSYHPLNSNTISSLNW